MMTNAEFEEVITESSRQTEVAETAIRALQELCASGMFEDSDQEILELAQERIVDEYELGK